MPPSSLPTTRVALRRIMEIDRLIREGRYPNKPWLARHLEVSINTLDRDFIQMRDQFGLPAVYSQQHNGFYYKEEPARVPELQVTEGDLFHFAMAGAAIQSYRGLDFEPGIRKAFDRIAAQLDQALSSSVEGLRAVVSFHPSGYPAPIDPKIFETLHTAILTRSEIDLRYRKPEETRATRRRIEPLHLMTYEQAWYCLACDPGERLVKAFALARITHPKKSGRQFDERPGFDPEQYLAGGFGMFGNPNPEAIHLRFSKSAARRVKEREWHPTQRITEKSNGSLEMRLDATVNVDLDRWLWRFPGEVEVLTPAHLRERLRKAGEAVAKRNR